MCAGIQGQQKLEPFVAPQDHLLNPETPVSVYIVKRLEQSTVVFLSPWFCTHGIHHYVWNIHHYVYFQGQGRYK